MPSTSGARFTWLHQHPVRADGPGNPPSGRRRCPCRRRCLGRGEPKASTLPVGVDGRARGARGARPWRRRPPPGSWRRGPGPGRPARAGAPPSETRRRPDRADHRQPGIEVRATLLQQQERFEGDVDALHRDQPPDEQQPERRRPGRGSDGRQNAVGATSGIARPRPPSLPGPGSRRRRCDDERGADQQPPVRRPPLLVRHLGQVVAVEVCDLRRGIVAEREPDCRGVRPVVGVHEIRLPPSAARSGAAMLRRGGRPPTGPVPVRSEATRHARIGDEARPGTTTSSSRPSSTGRSGVSLGTAERPPTPGRPSP